MSTIVESMIQAVRDSLSFGNFLLNSFLHKHPFTNWNQLLMRVNFFRKFEYTRSWFKSKEGHCYGNKNWSAIFWLYPILNLTPFNCWDNSSIKLKDKNLTQFTFCNIQRHNLMNSKKFSKMNDSLRRVLVSLPYIWGGCQFEMLANKI